VLAWLLAVLAGGLTGVLLTLFVWMVAEAKRIKA